MKARIVGIAFLGVLIVFSLCATQRTTIVYNVTESAPRGWYWIRQTPVLLVGDYVLAELPAPAAELAAQRRYLPLGVPVLKTIGASFGQSVCVHGNIVSIDGQTRAIALQRDGSSRPLQSWQQCRVLRMNEYFLLNTQHAASFDSRYFGPVELNSVHGMAIPLWTWSTP